MAAEVLLCVTALGVGLASVFCPLLNTESFLVVATSAADPAALLALVSSAALGQVAGNAALYHAARRGLALPSVRLRRALDALRSRAEGCRRLGGVLLFTSALTGLPPFATASLLAGVLRRPLGSYLVLAAAGRLLRFTAVSLLWRSLAG